MHAATPNPTVVLTQAVRRAAGSLGLSDREVAGVVGLRSRLLRDPRIQPGSKRGELALIFLRVFRSLDSLLGGDAEACRSWLRSYNYHLGGVPAELMRTVTGLVRVADYLDAISGS